jgi:hypothetical protein
VSKSNGFNKQSSRGGRGGAFASINQAQGSWQQRFDKVRLAQTCVN